MNVLIVNPGSTATKYKVFGKKGEVLEVKNFPLRASKEEIAFLENLKSISKIGIRVVHGGDFSETRELTERIKKHIERAQVFSPLHNKRALETIQRLEMVFPQVKIFATFDTHFHRTIPAYLSTYPLPKRIQKKMKFKKYGFHGIAVQSALSIFRELREKQKKSFPQKIIVAHLGGGSSVTAVYRGKSLSNTMELTPLSGIMMITRSGSVDPEISLIIQREMSMTSEEVSYILNYKSGFYGLTGKRDTKEIIERAQRGEDPYKIAFDMYLSQLVQQIWAYAGLMQGVDVIIFSGGIGYGNSYLRNEIYKKVKKLGIGKRDIYPIDIDEEYTIFCEIKDK